MSVAGISSNLFETIQNTQSTQNQTQQNQIQQFQQEFEQLGEDLQSGNLSAAQSDFATLQQIGSQSNSTNATSSTSSSQSNNPVQQAFNQLAQDLQSGNLSAAQQDYSNIQSDFQNTGAHGHHHHHEGGNGENNAINQSFQQLGQALQSGNLSAAQQAFSTLSQQLSEQPAGQTNAVNPETAQLALINISLSA